MTVRDVLKSAFAFLFEMEEQMNDICDNMGNASEDEMNAMMEELGTIQDLLMAHDFYIIDSKVEEVGRALGLNDIGMDKDVTELSGGQRTKAGMKIRYHFIMPCLPISAGTPKSTVSISFPIVLIGLDNKTH